MATGVGAACCGSAVAARRRVVARVFAMLQWRCCAVSAPPALAVLRTGLRYRRCAIAGAVEVMLWRCCAVAMPLWRCCSETSRSERAPLVGLCSVS